MIKLSDAVQAWPHDEPKLTLWELWLWRGMHALHSYHLVLTQGMVKLLGKKKKKEAKMYERD